MRVFRLIPTLLALMLLSNAATAATAAEKLPALGADPTKTSTSGLSSGAFMALQYDVAFSASTIGVGVVAGGPYNCFGVNGGDIHTCMQGAPKGAASYAAAQGFANLRQIDSIDHLASQKIYMFSGTNDLVVKIGIHEGSCLAVMLNERQDYFGQTVNIAARVQGLSTSQAIHITGPVIDAPAVAAILDKAAITPIQKQAALRGIADKIVVYEIP